MSERPSELSRESGWFYIGGAALVTLPAILFRAGSIHGSVELETIAFGLAILGAAFLLSWGAEVAQLDISQALAIAFLAFIAVLPEYAVDLTFAWKAGAQDHAPVAMQALCGEEFLCRELAVANMTGANRLLIGLGWSAVVLLWAFRSKQTGVALDPSHRTEIGFLLLATLWAFTIPIRGYLTVLDLIVLFTMFVAYIWRAARAEAEHPELIGPPVVIAALSKAKRRLVTLALFIFAASVILAAAEPFAEGLVEIGHKFNINTFLLVQWLAPLASEAPEMIIAILFVVRAKPAAGLGTLVSSKVNQWTLLIATIPLVYSLSRGGLHGMHLTARQDAEIFLTAAQSLFAIAVLANLTINKKEAVGLLVLFLAQFGFAANSVRYGFGITYIALTVLILAKERGAFKSLMASLRVALTPPWR